jgi:hydrogenase expression/formation protein HypD
MIREAFDVCDREWRGIGVIPASGLTLRPGFSQFDAALRFPQRAAACAPESRCIAGAVLRGRSRPPDCPCFGNFCTPAHPLGAPMVSSEGACSAWYSYGRTN